MSNEYKHLKIIGIIYIVSLFVFMISGIVYSELHNSNPFSNDYAVIKCIATISGAICVIITFIVILGGIISLCSSVIPKRKKLYAIIAAIVIILFVYVNYYVFKNTPIKNDNTYTVKVVEVKINSLLVEYEYNGDLTTKEIKKPLFSFVKPGDLIEVNSVGDMEYKPNEVYCLLIYFISMTLVIVVCVGIPQHYRTKNGKKKIC